MSIFNEKGNIKKSHIRRAIRDDTGRVPSSNKRYFRKERENIFEEVFGTEGDYVSEQDFRQGIKELEKQARQASLHDEQWGYKYKARYLQKFLESEEG